MNNYKTETEKQIAENEKNLTKFNTRIANQKIEARQKFKSKIAELEGKNSDMKKKLADFKTDNKADWEKFKMEFKNDMEQLGNAFRDFGVDNK